MSALIDRYGDRYALAGAVVAAMFFIPPVSVYFSVSDFSSIVFRWIWGAFGRDSLRAMRPPCPQDTWACNQLVCASFEILDGSDSAPPSELLKLRLGRAWLPVTVTG